MQPAEVDNNISAKLEMYFQSVTDFFQEAMQAGAENASFLDLVISSPGLGGESKAEGEDPGANTDGPQSKTCIDQHLTRKYVGANYRVKMVAGWSTPTDMTELYPGLGYERALALQRAIEKSKTILFLQQTRHLFDFKEDGSVTLSIEYQAALSGLLSGKTANIFAPSTNMVQDKIEAKQSEIDALSDHAATDRSSARELTAKLEEMKRLKQEDKLAKYQKLLKGIFCSKKIYNLAIDRKEFALPQWSQLTPKQRARRALRKQRQPLQVIMGGSAENSAVLDAVSAAIRSADTDASAATSEELVSKYDLLDKENLGGTTFISYFYLGDLIDNVLSQIETNQGRALDFKMFLSEVAMIDPLQALKVSNLAEILESGQSLENMVFLQALASSDPENFSGLTGVTQLMNIGDIPISIDAFQIWFKDNVIKKDRDNYYFLHFVKDLCSDLISAALKSYCFGPDIQFIQRFDAQPISLKKPHSDLPDPFRGHRINNTPFPLKGEGTTLASLRAGLTETLRGKSSVLAIILLSTDSKPKNLHGVYHDDIPQGVYHHYLGSPCGLVKKIKFNREDQPMLREVKIQKKGALGAEQLRELYSAQMELYGNTLYKNGNYVYINPMLMGATKKQLTLLGLHGYYLITAVESKLTENSFDVSVKALLEGQEFCDNTLLAPESYGKELAPETQLWFSSEEDRAAANREAPPPTAGDIVRARLSGGGVPPATGGATGGGLPPRAS